MSLYNSKFLITFTSLNLQQYSRPGCTEQQNTNTYMDPDRVQRSEKFSATFFSTMLCLPSLFHSLPVTKKSNGSKMIHPLASTLMPIPQA